MEQEEMARNGSKLAAEWLKLLKQTRKILMMPTSRDSPDSQAPSGTVELREDVPLKARANAAPCCADGPRLILGAFAVLTVAITLALLTQIYSGDYQLVPHGSVSSSAAACSRAGTDALKAGGRALDAAVAAALCLATVAPHRTSLDASGALLYWEYRNARTQPPVLYEWGGDGTGRGQAPRLVAALAGLHSRLGVLPWSRLLAPAIQIASAGFPVSEGLSLASAAAGLEVPALNTNITAPTIAHYLSTLLSNDSKDLSLSWDSDSLVRESSPLQITAGSWRLVLGGPSAAVTGRALTAALAPPPGSPDEAQLRVVAALQQEAVNSTWPPGGVATGLAVVDHRDTYIALVTGLSVPFGSGPEMPAGWTRDVPTASLDLAPAFLLDASVCGTRYVIGAESSAALAQGGAALLTDGTAGAVEKARVELLVGGKAALEAARPLPPATLLPSGPLLNASQPYPALNLVQQKGDALLSHADSRGGGLASRF